MGMWGLFILLGPFYLLSQLVSWVANPTSPAWKGWVLAISLFLCNVLQTISIQLQFYWALKLQLRIRGSVMSAVYRKATRIGVVKSVGQVVNLVSNDVQRLMDLATWYNFLWVAPVILIAVTVLLIIQIGWPGIMGASGSLKESKKERKGRTKKSFGSTSSEPRPGFASQC